jgi:DNA polymerase-3 subunit epsilon
MDKQYAIIDIETTGGSPLREKITEIAIAIFDGDKIIEKYESLVNPERSIPPFITRLTGISNEMVQNAPKFYEIAKEVVEITKDKIFVAHNVRFDYGFIQEEFKRLGYNYSRPKMCTVRMSRKAFPGLRSYSLGKLIKYFDIPVNARHRAMADVLATVELFKNILAQSGTPASRNDLFKQSLKNINLPETITTEHLMELPEETGIYYFLDKDEEIIYVGKSVNIRKRIKQHFQNINPKSNKLYQRAHKIRYELTGSEMVAFLLENQEIKRLQPEINRAARKKNFGYFIHYFLNTSGYIEFAYSKNTKILKKNKQILSEHLNLLSSKAALKCLQVDYELCEKLVGLSFGEGPCFEMGLERCRGACLYLEPTEKYNQRALLASKKVDSINPENFIMIDTGRTPDEQAVVLIREGNFHGFNFLDKELNISDPEEWVDHIPKTEFYRDSNTIIKRFLNKPNGIKIVEFK